MSLKSTLFAVIVFFCSVVVAEAQSSSGEATSGGVISADQVATLVAVGWNFFHVSNCSVDGRVSPPVFYVFPQETALFSFIFAIDPTVITTITPACQTGNIIGIFVSNISGSAFTYNQVFTYAYK